MNSLLANIAASAVSRRVRLNFERRKLMKKLFCILLIFTIIFTSTMLVSCQEKLPNILDDMYILDTPLSRFFLDTEFKKTLNTHLVVCILGENDTLDIDFFGSQYVKAIESVSYTSRVRQNPYDPNEIIRCTQYTLELHKDSKFNLLYVAYKLSKLPGVFTVDAFVEGDLYCAVPNDTYYTENEAWGLKSIEIEKVWDFVTGVVLTKFIF